MAFAADAKKLAVNTGLSFLAAFVTSFGLFISQTPKNPGTSALLAAAGAAVYAGGRAAVGYIKARFGTPVSVDA